MIARLFKHLLFSLTRHAPGRGKCGRCAAYAPNEGLCTVIWAASVPDCLPQQRRSTVESIGEIFDESQCVLPKVVARAEHGMFRVDARDSCHYERAGIKIESVNYGFFSRLIRRRALARENRQIKREKKSYEDMLHRRHHDDLPSVADVIRMRRDESVRRANGGKAPAGGSTGPHDGPLAGD